MSDPSSTIQPATKRKPMSRGFIYTVIGIFVFIFVLLAAIGPIEVGIKYAQHGAVMQQVRQIGQGIFSYASDHNGLYPDGNSSTEVFKSCSTGTMLTIRVFFTFLLQARLRQLLDRN